MNENTRKIIEQFLHTCITTSTWIANKIEREENLDAETQTDIKLLRRQIDDVRKYLADFERG